MEATEDDNSRWPPGTIGKVVGGAFGLSLGIFLAIKATWIFLLIAFSPIWTPVPFLLVFLIPTVFGVAIGTSLAKLNFVPPLRPIHVLAIAIVVAFGPLAIGFGEVWFRGSPFSLPDDTTIIRWQRSPGAQTLYLESPESVPALHEQLVLSAKEAGWACVFCQYQPSTGTGHASLKSTDKTLGGPGGTIGFEIWPGDMALYGVEPSKLTQLRISHQWRSWTIEWAMLAVTLTLAVGMVRYSERGPTG